MKNSILLLVLIFAVAAIQAQTFQISFAGTGASMTVDSVRVENLVQCTDTTLGGSEFLQCHAGDTLKLTGISGVYRTVVMLVPTQGQAVIFSFVPCTDADSNHYAVVQIGNQLWMEENLKTTSYRDGSGIPNITDSATWRTTDNGAYCDYHNLPAEGERYGHFYNFYALADSLNMCPVGWHVPSISEWLTLTDFLGGAAIAGQKLKENCSTRWAYLDTTWGTNQVGFTALCTNFRTATGSWSLAPNNDHDSFLWTSTEYNTSTAWAVSLRWCYRDLWMSGYPFKRGGYSVRCVKDSVTTNTDNLDYWNGLKIYPNPAIDKVYIDYPGNQVMKLEVYTMIGECVLQRKLTNNKNELDISSLPNAVYVIRLIGADRIMQGKLVKEN